MIELRYLMREVKIENEMLCNRDGSPVMEDATECVLQWRTYGPKESGFGVKLPIALEWSDWRDVPTVRE